MENVTALGAALNCPVLLKHLDCHVTRNISFCDEVTKTTTKTATIIIIIIKIKFYCINEGA